MNALSSHFSFNFLPAHDQSSLLSRMWLSALARPSLLLTSSTSQWPGQARTDAQQRHHGRRNPLKVGRVQSNYQDRSVDGVAV